MSAKAIAMLYVFESSSSAGKTYQTLVYTDGSTSCECKGWVFKRKTAGGARTCKHVRMVESGMAEQHAVKTVRYAEAETPRRVAAEPRMSQPELSRRPRSRVITLD